MTIAQSFGQSSFSRFVNSRAGRMVRIMAGVALFVFGFINRDSTAVLVAFLPMAVGLAAAATGALDLCVASAVLGGPIRGRRILQREPGGAGA